MDVYTLLQTLKTNLWTQMTPEEQSATDHWITYYSAAHRESSLDDSEHLFEFRHD